MTQAETLKIMKTGVNIYLTGSAGSGKTYLLNQYISYLQDHEVSVAVTASTGIAATHMNGMTIHGWSGIGIRNKLDEKDLEQIEDKKYLWKRFEKARVLIIDEVSMLHGYQLDMIELICRRFKRNNAPFGGLQVILSGDFFQLPPVQKRREPQVGLMANSAISPTCGSKMVYKSRAWKILNPAICYLTEQHRQEDEDLTEILNTIRNNNLEEKHYEQLRSRIDAKLKNNNKATKLYTHNINVDNENFVELAQIEGDEKKYKMSSTGPDVLVEILKKSCLAYEELCLKVGAEIMCIKNNFEKGYVNGSRGKVIDFDNASGQPIIKLYNGKVIIITPMDWVIEENNKIKASLTQLPIRLAWAITIHKSQGMSLDNAEIDLRRTFTHGMGYVALSRVRTLSGIKLIGFNSNALKVDPEVLEFDQELKNESTQNELLFKKLKDEEQSKLEGEFILKMGGKIEKQPQKKKEIKTKIPTTVITKELLDEGMSIKQIAVKRGMVYGTIINHIEQILEQNHPEGKVTSNGAVKVDISHIRPRQDYIELVRKANNNLKGDEKGKLTPIKRLLEKEGHNLSFEEIRLARLFI